ncbi:MAG: TetR/AcrR family transcriptional regulator [Candidatus Promineifilaceae bacterium]
MTDQFIFVYTTGRALTVVFYPLTTRAMTHKRTNNPEGNRAKVLQAAQELFIEKGFEGTSMSLIARRSGITQSLIHHYFGSKEGLWQAVKQEAYGSYLAHQQQLLDQDDGHIVNFIQSSVRGRFQFFQSHPQVAKLLSWLQILEDPFGMETGQDVARQMLAKIRQAQAEGSIRADMEPENILAISLALTTHWFQNRPVIQHYAELDEAAAADARYLEAVVKVLVEGLQARGG